MIGIDILTILVYNNMITSMPTIALMISQNTVEWRKYERKNRFEMGRDADC